jgi:hypothetical protein
LALPFGELAFPVDLKRIRMVGWQESGGFCEVALTREGAADAYDATIIASATRPPGGGRQAIDPVATSRMLWVSTRRIE